MEVDSNTKMRGDFEVGDRVEVEVGGEPREGEPRLALSVNPPGTLPKFPGELTVGILPEVPKEYEPVVAKEVVAKEAVDTSKQAVIGTGFSEAERVVFARA